jgi:hypothetical protein
LFEHALRPLFNFFCKKETGNELSNVINLYLVYTFENIILQKPDFKNSTIKDVVSSLCVLYILNYFSNYYYNFFFLIITIDVI